MICRSSITAAIFRLRMPRNRVGAKSGLCYHQDTASVSYSDHVTVSEAASTPTACTCPSAYFNVSLDVCLTLERAP